MTTSDGATRNAYAERTARVGFADNGTVCFRIVVVLAVGVVGLCKEKEQK